MKYILNIKSLMLMAGIFSMLFMSSCDKDETLGYDHLDFNPRINENFSFAVEGNNVVFSTTMMGNVWFSKDGRDYMTVDGVAKAFIAREGTYEFTCTSLGSGDMITSTPFEVVIEQTDYSYLKNEMWINLTGGKGKSKSWRLDITSEGLVSDLWPAPVSFANDANYSSWTYIPTGPDDVSFLNWAPDWEGNTWLMPAADYGTLTFSADDQVITSDRPEEGISNETGSFDIDTVSWMLNISGTVILRDPGRIPKFDDWSNVRIFTLTENKLALGVKRVRNDAGDPDPWIEVFNFIPTDYVIDLEEFTWTEPVRTSFTAADLEGTWVYAAVPQNWVGWTGTGDRGTVNPSKLLNSWTTRDGIVNDLTSWGASDAAAVFTANDAKEFTFNNDGTCTLAGVANTYTVTDGVITFGTDLTDEFSCVWIGLSGAGASVLDVKLNNDGSDYVDDGSIWIGQKNGDKDESSCIHLMKK